MRLYVGTTKQFVRDTVLNQISEKLMNDKGTCPKCGDIKIEEITP